MSAIAMGGASSAVAASSHAACARFRGTDPLITKRTRRQLARELGHPDTSGRIPEARWMRAMVFERLVRDDRFASRVATTTVGRLGLPRPDSVIVADAKLDRGTTIDLLNKALAVGNVREQGDARARACCGVPGIRGRSGDQRASRLHRCRASGRHFRPGLAGRRRRERLRARPLEDRRRAVAEGVPPGRLRSGGGRTNGPSYRMG